MRSSDKLLQREDLSVYLVLARHGGSLHLREPPGVDLQDLLPTRAAQLRQASPGDDGQVDARYRRSHGAPVRHGVPAPGRHHGAATDRVEHRRHRRVGADRGAVGQVPDESRV